MEDSGAVRSAANAKLKAVRALREGRSRDGLMLEGRHLLEEALAAGAQLRWVLHEEGGGRAGSEDDGGGPLQSLLEAARAAGAEVQACEPQLLREGSDLDAPSGLLAWAERPAASAAAILDGAAAGEWCLVAGGVQDPGNLGALVRVAAGLGARGVLTLKGGATPWHPRALRGASGTTFRLPVAERVEVADLGTALRAAGWHCVGADADGASPDALREVARAAPVALLMGEEGRGLRTELRELCDSVVGIPLARGVESLNVATAAAVLAWELRRDAASKTAMKSAPTTEGGA